MRQGWLEGTTNMWPAGLLLCNLTLHSINLPLFPTYTFKKEEGLLVKNPLEELWKQPAREGESCSCRCSSPAEPQTSQISQGEVVWVQDRGKVCESVCATEAPKDVTYTPRERGKRAVTGRRLSSHVLDCERVNSLWQKWLFQQWMKWNDDVYLVSRTACFLKVSKIKISSPKLLSKRGKRLVISSYWRECEELLHHHGSASQQLHAERPPQQPSLGLHEEPSLRGPWRQSAVALPAGPFRPPPEAWVPGLHRLLQLLPGADRTTPSLPSRRQTVPREPVPENWLAVQPLWDTG